MKNKKIIKYQTSCFNFKKIITCFILNYLSAKEQYFILDTNISGLWNLIHRFASSVYQEIHTPSTVIGDMHEFSGLMMLRYWNAETS